MYEFNEEMLTPKFNVYTHEQELADKIATLRTLYSLKSAVASYMGPDYKTYKGIRVIDILDFMIEAMKASIEAPKAEDE